MIKTVNQTIRARGSEFLIKTMDVELTRKDSSKSSIANFECISYLTPTTRAFTLIPILKRDASSLGILLKRYERPGWNRPVLEFPNFSYDFQETPAGERLRTLQNFFEKELNFLGLQNFHALTNKFDVYRDPWKSDIRECFFRSETDLEELKNENPEFDFENFLAKNENLAYFELNDKNRLENLRKMGDKDSENGTG